MSKIYKALITQRTIRVTESPLIIGKEYMIMDYYAPDDFSNVGAVNGPQQRFIATGTTPAEWSNDTFLIDVAASAPTDILFVNTIGNYKWHYYDSGVYYIQFLGKVLAQKCIYYCNILPDASPFDLEGQMVGIEIGIDADSIRLNTGVDNDLLGQMPMTIELFD